MGTLDRFGVLRFERLDFKPELTVLETLPNGAEVLFRKPYGRHPMDNYLDVVLCWWNGKFVTWMRNLQCGGCDHGHYFDLPYAPEDADLSVLFVEALMDFDKRGLHTAYGSKAAQRLGVKNTDLTAA
jgi:hypothetical protein